MNHEIATLLKHQASLVRVMRLEPKEISPKHYHSFLQEYIVCLEGQISVLTEQSNRAISLQPGENFSIKKNVTHWLENYSDRESRYLLVQSGGEYDFIKSAT
jgi:quercetin dioxygenase-like cupin family protein